MSQTKAELINAKGDAAFDTNTLFVDSTNNRVGVGTTIPSGILHTSASNAVNIFESPGISSVGLRFRTNNSDRWQLQVPSASADLALYTGAAASEVLRVDSSGRLLVGTPSSRTINGITGNLQLEGTTFNGGTASLVVNTNDGNCPFFHLGKSRGTTNGANTVVQSGDYLGVLGWYGADGSNLIEAARIETRVDGTPGANDMPGRLVFSTTADGAASPTERMRISNSGVTSVFSSGSSTFIPRSSAAANTSNFFIQGAYSATGTTDGTVSFQVFTNGNVQNTNNSYGAISDIKLKENIVDASSQWSDIKALQVRKYNFKEGQTHTQIGLVAQEVELVSPGLVTESPDRDEDGNDLGTVTKSVNYSVLYMKAVKALQEAMERIETLEAKVAALESA